MTEINDSRDKVFSPTMLGKRVEISTYHVSDDSLYATSAGFLNVYSQLEEVVSWAFEGSRAVGKATLSDYYILIEVLNN